MHDQALENVRGLVGNDMVHNPDALSSPAIARRAYPQSKVGDRPAQLSDARTRLPCLFAHYPTPRRHEGSRPFFCRPYGNQSVINVSSQADPGTTTQPSGSWWRATAGRIVLSTTAPEIGAANATPTRLRAAAPGPGPPFHRPVGGPRV